MGGLLAVLSALRLFLSPFPKQVGRFLLAVGITPLLFVEPIVYTEAFAGGMLTTVVFATMMSAADHELGATHYTALSGQSGDENPPHPPHLWLETSALFSLVEMSCLLKY